MNNCIAYKYEDNSLYDSRYEYYCATKGSEFFLNIEQCKYNSDTSSLKYYNITSNSSYSGAKKDFSLICTNDIKVSRSCGTPIHEHHENIIGISCNDTKYCFEFQGNDWNVQESSCYPWAENLYRIGFSLVPSALLSTLISFTFYKPRVEEETRLHLPAVVSMLTTPLLIDHFSDYIQHEEFFKSHLNCADAQFYNEHTVICGLIPIGLFSLFSYAISVYMPALGSGIAAVD